jgi:hypothetical protein
VALDGERLLVGLGKLGFVVLAESLDLGVSVELELARRLLELTNESLLLIVATLLQWK